MARKKRNGKIPTKEERQIERWETEAKWRRKFNEEFVEDEGGYGGEEEEMWAQVRSQESGQRLLKYTEGSLYDS